MIEKLSHQSDVELILKVRKDLELQEKRFLRHISTKHKGFPVEECHNCGYYIQAILNDKEIIKSLEN